MTRYLAALVFVPLVAACGSTVSGGGDSGSGSGGSGGAGANTGASTGTSPDTTTVTNGAGGYAPDTSVGVGGYGAVTTVGVGGYGGTPGVGGAGGASPGTTGIAMLYSELPTDGAGGGASVAGVTTGPGPDPNTLLIQVSDSAISCDGPFGLECGDHWLVSVGVPPELQQPGVMTLRELNASFSITGPTGNECFGGGGSFWDGTMEILSINDIHVELRFEGTSTFDFNANGDHVAYRCFQ